jgi:hypothetical protein
MGRKKKYNTPYERLKAHRKRQFKQKKPKFSNEEKLEIAKKENEELFKFSKEEEWRILGSDPDNKRVWNETISEVNKEGFREFYAKANTKQAWDFRFEVYHFLKALNKWLREKNLEFPPEYLVSEFEIWSRKHPIEGLNIMDLSKIPHDPKNRVVTNSEEIRQLKDAYREIWIREYPKDKDHPHSLLVTMDNRGLDG